MKCYVVTEGAGDQAVLSTLLKGVVPFDEVKIVHAKGRSSAVSLARTLLTTRKVRVALFADADSTDQNQIDERRAELRDSLAVTSPERFEVFLAAPTLEACLFEDQSGLQDEFGEALSPELLVKSRYEPKQVIKQLFDAQKRPYTPDGQTALIQRLDLDRLREAPVIKELTKFVLGVVLPEPT